MARRGPLTDDEAMLAVPAPGPPAVRGGEEVLLGRMREELQSGFAALAPLQRAVSVFGSARTGPGEPDYELARACAARLGREGYAIITGGGHGIMEAANRGARDAGSPSIGLAIEQPQFERVNDHLDVLLRFHYHFTRKLMFVRYASAFIVLPGGFGTLDELFELVALIQTGKVRAPPVVLVRSAYWEPLVAWLRNEVLSSGNISAEDLGLLVLADDADEVCRHLGAAT